MGNICCAEDTSSGSKGGTKNIELLEASPALQIVDPHTAKPSPLPVAADENTASVQVEEANEKASPLQLEAAETAAKTEAEEAISKSDDADKIAASATECEYTINLKKFDSSAQWGFGLRYDEERLCIRQVQGASLDEWHKNNPTKRVRSGDELVSVNGTSGPPKTLVAAMTESAEISIVLRRQLQFCVTAKKPIGLAFDTDTLEVREITAGSIKAYNDADVCPPHLEVTAGDILASVNEKTSRLLEEIEQKGETEQIKLTFTRPKIG